MTVGSEIRHTEFDALGAAMVNVVRSGDFRWAGRRIALALLMLKRPQRS